MQLMQKSSCGSCKRAHAAHVEELMQESSCRGAHASHAKELMQKSSCRRAHAVHTGELMQLMQKSSALTKEVSSAR